MKQPEKITEASGLDTMSPSMEKADNYARWIIDAFRPFTGEKILEIGAGFGNYRKLLPGASRYAAVDISGEAVARAKEKNPGGEYLVADVQSDSFAASLGGEPFDTVLCINVLEHLDDPAKALENMLGVLERGGRLLLFVPAFPFLFTQMDRLAGHRRRYTTGSLAEIIPHGQCEIKMLEYFNPIGGLGWLANRLLKPKAINQPGVNFQVDFFDRYVLPFSKSANALTKKIFGQSVICAVEKK